MASSYTACSSTDMEFEFEQDSGSTETIANANATATNTNTNTEDNDNTKADCDVEASTDAEETADDTVQGDTAQVQEAEDDEPEYHPNVIKCLRLVNTKLKTAAQKQNDEVVDVLLDSMRVLIKMMP